MHGLSADSWIGSDVSIPVTVRITEMSRAEKEGRSHRGKALPLDDDEPHSAGRQMVAPVWCMQLVTPTVPSAGQDMCCNKSCCLFQLIPQSVCSCQCHLK